MSQEKVDRNKAAKASRKKDMQKEIVKKLKELTFPHIFFHPFVQALLTKGAARNVPDSSNSMTMVQLLKRNLNLSLCHLVNGFLKPCLCFIVYITEPLGCINNTLVCSIGFYLGWI